MKIQDLLLKFQGVKQVSENQYMAICPAHDDHSPSLSIGLSKDGKQILLNCFAGCKAEDVLNSVGLRLKDLYDNDGRNETNLKNVGYDIAKPDRHIRRILGRNILDCSEHENAPVYEAIDIVAAIARQLNRPAAEVDYILWAYCAKNYGEICTKNNPHCDRCVVKINCKKAEV